MRDLWLKWYWRGHRLYYKLRQVPRRIRLGFWPSEAWDLGCSTAEYVLPRLRYMRSRCTKGIPSQLCFTSEGKERDYAAAELEWDTILDEIEWYLEQVSSDDSMASYKERERYAAAGCSFGYWLPSLWS